jgi:8-amino-7-oxononanoate synthase
VHRTPLDAPTKAPPHTLIDALRSCALAFPERQALSFLPSGEAVSERLTYAELDRRARALAAALQAKGLSGERALIPQASSPNFVVAFCGTLYAGLTAVPAAPPHRRRRAAFDRMVREADPAIALSDTPCEGLEIEHLALGEATAGEGAWCPPEVDPQAPAFLQFSSGSTGAPRGVVVTHANVLANVELIRRCMGTSHADDAVIWLPPHHDMGLVGGLLTPLTSGFPITLIPPIAVLQRPIRWLRAIAAKPCAISGGPNFAFDLCVDRTTPEQREGLDLSSWRLAFNGAEPVRPETLDRFCQTFAPYGFRREALFPCYGLAESTLFVAGSARHEPPLVRASARRTVGYPLDSEVRVDVLDAEGNPCPEGVEGEVCVQSQSVAAGYWRRPEESARSFRGGVLHTGDLGFLEEGTLYVTGRCDDVMLFAGRKVYPDDVERSVRGSHPGIRPHSCAAFAVDAGGPRLVVAVELDRHSARSADPDEVFAAVRGAIADLDVAGVLLLRQGQVPVTTSGKVRRARCRELFAEGAWTPIASSLRPPLAFGQTAEPEGDAEGVLRAELARLLGCSPASVPWDQPLGDLGLGSLKALDLQERLQGRTQREVPVERLARLSARELLALHGGREVPEAGAPGACGAVERQDRIERFPELVELRRRLAELPVRNPYFVAHEGTNGARTRVAGQERINFSGYDYLGLCDHPQVLEGAQDALRRYGTSVSASRVAGGETPLHRELEEEIAAHLGVDAALTWVGGFTTNVSVIGHLTGPSDLVVHDELIHNSVLQGVQLSGAERASFSHSDPGALDALLERRRGVHRRVLVVIEGVYSMDGDVPDLARFVEIKRRHQALLMIDEAHSMGVLGASGRGLAEHCGVDPREVDIWMGTLSKALASCGGFIAGGHALIELLRYTAPGFVYSAGIPPGSVGAALAALRVLRREPERVARLQANARLFLELAREAGLDTGPSAGSPVVPVVVGDSARCMRLSDRLASEGIGVMPIVFPAVPEGQARLRFFLSAAHEESDLRHAVSAVAESLRALS